MAELKALLDTNIIIHRENNHLTNESIGMLCWWLDKLRYKKCIHQCSVDEIHKHKDTEYVGLLDIKIESYEHLNKFEEPNEDFLNRIITKYPLNNSNDIVDNQLLFEVYQKRVDLLITEDNKIKEKSKLFQLNEKVLTIDEFISKCKKEYPELRDYKFNSIKQMRFGDVNLKDEFFDSLRSSYEDFDNWYKRKYDKFVYVHYDENDKLTGFLYLKPEGKDEDYTDIVPRLEPGKRLKIGTFKVISTGYRLGERFLQIIFDNAIDNDVDEIYVTMFNDTDDLQKLKNLLIEWGFVEFGYKKEKEIVLVKNMKHFNENITVKQNFPNINYNVKKWFLPILPQYHTRLFPDSILYTEKNDTFPDYLGYRYALEKCYISFSYKRDFKVGDVVLIYRCAYSDEIKAYKSVISSICVISEIHRDLKSKKEMLDICKNRTVFSNDELEYIYNGGINKAQIVKMLYVCPLNIKIILKQLRENGIIGATEGPRPFDEISEAQFEKIIKLSDTKLYDYK